jgi:hypothetical protein
MSIAMHASAMFYSDWDCTATVFSDFECLCRGSRADEANGVAGMSPAACMHRTAFHVAGTRLFIAQLA